MRRKQIPYDSVLQLRQRLEPPKSPERAAQVAAMATLYGVSTDSVYRALREFNRPKAAHGADQGRQRVLQQAELERYCELVAALKLRTTNREQVWMRAGAATIASRDR
jgi:hypothetical protein